MKSALIAIEFQNEWLDPNGKLYSLMKDRDQFRNSSKNASSALEHARRIALPVFHSGLKFSADYHELGIAQYGLRAAIPLHGTFRADQFGSDFYPTFIPHDNEFLVEGRNGSSAFAGSNFHNLLLSLQIERLYIMGYALHVCVESTVRAAHDLGYEVIVIEDACAAFTMAQCEYFYNEILPHFGHRLTTKQFSEVI